MEDEIVDADLKLAKTGFKKLRADEFKAYVEVNHFGRAESEKAELKPKLDLVISEINLGELELYLAELKGDQLERE
uniref:AlNc14C46G3746 protein n=1 Tax=Albugo laibachii Nc14 TaxID=890382 RepID=F0WAN2_9STRA|nr:AlNc14C46G3746 [Albugo laibachii Nc14]|eukprot:CCA18203.1 AlNc14C46G3746 [Albugo laibachii Nc14]